jgi:hypothetical protein
MLDELEVVRDTLDAPRSDPTARERARQRLLEAVAGEERERILLPPRADRPRRLAPWFAVGVAAVVAFLLVASILQAPHPRRPSPTPLAASSALRSLASAATMQPTLRVRKDSYFLVSSDQVQITGQGSGTDSVAVVTTGQSVNFAVRRLIQTWIRPDGSGVRLTTPISVTFASPEDERVWDSLDDKPPMPTVGQPVRDEFGPGGLYPYDVSGLPTKPAALLSSLRMPDPSSAPYDDQQVTGQIANLLIYGDPSPKLRSALFEVLARLPGIKSEGQIVDPRGRSGIGLILQLGGTSKELILDPVTTTVLATIDRHSDGSIGFTATFDPPSVGDLAPETTS